MFADFGFSSLSFQTQIRAHPDTLPLARIDFAPPLITAPARAIALILRALRYRAKISRIEQRAIAAILAAV